MNVDYNIIMPMVFKFGLEIDVWIKVDEISKDEGVVDYGIYCIAIWSDRRDEFVSPSTELRDFIEEELDKYPRFVEDMEIWASREAEESALCHADFQMEVMKEERAGL